MMKKSIGYLKDSTLFKEYNFNKNNIDYELLTLGSDKIVWWICSKGHEWEASIGSRFRSNSGCPICSNKIVLEGYNDLKTTHPKIASEWDCEKNDGLLPSLVSSGSNKKVWWKCSKGHEWEAIISNRTKVNGTGCPYCSNQKVLKGFNDLKTKYPEIAKEWDYEKNELKPSDYLYGSSHKVWWICNNNHSYSCQIYSRTANGVSCPICAGKTLIKGFNDLETKYPEIAKGWDYEKNYSLTPRDVFPTSSKKVWWKCSKGHSYEQLLNNKIKHLGCPVCNKGKVTSFNEKIVAYYFKRYFKDIIENKKLDFLKGMDLDIYVPSKKIAVEYDGRMYHKNIEHDLKKDKLCCINKIKLYRIREEGCPRLVSSSDCYNLKNKSFNELISAIEYILLKEGIKTTIDYKYDLKEIYSYVEFNELSNSLETKYPEIAKEWDHEKNGLLLPSQIMAGSNKKVWWKCSKGHSYLTSPGKRTSSNRGCPYCSGNKVLFGYNDLETNCSNEILKEWDYDKNSLKPCEVNYKSQKKAWWKCSKGHSYEKAITSRLKGVSCPICKKLGVI